MPASTEKTTTPTPSLKSDSPVMTSSRFRGALVVRRMPITAIGSVGEMRAPNSRQGSSARGSPINGNTPQRAKPTTSVEARVPKTERRPTCQRYSRSSLRSTWSAPANSSSDSMPCISTAEKSTERSSAASYA